MISLETFLTQRNVSEKKVICFKGSHYPLLFLRVCAEQHAQKKGLTFSFCSMNIENQVALFAALQTSFLGAQSSYWLGSFDELSKNKQKVWTTFFSHYDGPHTLLFFSSSSFNQPVLTIELPDVVDAALFKKIAHIVQKKSVSFSPSLFRHTETLSLDEAYLLAQYDRVIGKKSTEFMHDWLPDIIIPHLSLFSLSQAFFDKKASIFFARWKQLASRYATPFWISFWSEQIWRAYCYVRFQHMGKQLEAKKMGYRLPFSFLNRTWRNYSLETLKTHHAFLYQIDYHMKNGGSSYALDLFYASFFDTYR